ncbi:PQQ-binding-like beta-propeller repeat protein [Streptomyces sp. MB09-01]|uniref:outer membrane protein assembly factor BamB family protein n=1 Tax=Streptomyces sp. MB09-01 TaxID=3028666 RepID=UPI0029AC48C8|nr:PQQ-binding-like beta-propeller repeat protein [Streptomyces sp. MB09-01]MDX3540898.1 PQQ-binding-like beta-propeller repeat protein [Streptomyces sp. MB09-01]
MTDEQWRGGFGPPPDPFEPQSQPQPQSQTQPPAQPVPAATGRFTGRTARVTALAVAVLLAVGGGTYLALGDDRDDRDEPSEARPSASPSIDRGDGKGPGVGPSTYDANAGIKPGEARVWLRDNDADLPGSGTSQYGPWRVGDVVVKAMTNELIGYAAADGQDKWKLSLPTPVCGVPPAPSADGKLVLGVKESASQSSHCNHLQQVDLTTGKAGWKVPVPPENSYDTALQFEMAISGDTVALARSAVMSGFSVTDGRKLFGTSKTNGCTAAGFAGGSRLIGLRTCFDPKDSRAPAQSLVEELDPATGTAKWSHTFDKGWTVGRVLSVDPLVVAAHHKDSKAWNITAFAADGKVRSQGAAGFGVSGRCNGFGNAGGYQECYAAAADADTLYIGAGKPGTSLGIEDTNQVVAVDLNTGKERWRTAEQPKGRTVWPLAVEDGRVLVYVAPGSGAAGSVVSLAPADGSSQPVLQSPAVSAGAESVFYTHNIRITWAGGRLFLLNGRVYGPEPKRRAARSSRSASSVAQPRRGTCRTRTNSRAGRTACTSLRPSSRSRSLHASPTAGSRQH